jgi:hypothetical protein
MRNHVSPWMKYYLSLTAEVLHLPIGRPHQLGLPPQMSTPGEKVWICYIDNEKGHKSPDCPSNTVGKKPKPGGSNLVVGKEDKTTN